MANVPVKAVNLGIYLRGIMVACAQSASLTINKEMLDAVCAGSGDWREVTPGSTSWEGSIDALWRVLGTAEAAANIDARDIFDMLVDGELVAIKFGYRDGSAASLNGYQLQGDAYFTSLVMNQAIGDNQTWTADFTGTGELVRAAPSA